MEPIKQPLDFEHYELYHIDQRYKAYVVSFEYLSENECDELEARYLEQGYKVFHVAMNRNSKGSFDLELVVAQLGYTF